MAPVLLSYGKALFELGFSQQGVMGKEEVTKTADAGKSLSAFLYVCTKWLMGRRSKSRR
jgi:hypothetical protein